MSIDGRLLESYPGLNEAQRRIIAHDGGPLLAIAGPGSGKTFSVALRSLNLLLSGKTSPEELMVATFTEKAAYELRDRIADAARTVGYEGDLTTLKLGTIHSLSNEIISDHRHRTPLGGAHETLDDLTQLLFIFDHFEEVLGEKKPEPPYMGRWKSKWGAISKLKEYFNKITEELVDPQALAADQDVFLSSMGEAYLRYRQALFGENRVDFSNQQKLAYELVESEEVGEAIASAVRYVIVDEYQDTNYIQERLLTKLANPNSNLMAVGDEDQSLYRFRGATVRNILEFPKRFPQAEVVKLTTNYRSHEAIVEAYDGWMSSFDWSAGSGGEEAFRFEKTIEADHSPEHPDYPAVFRIWGENKTDEAARFADLVAYLKREGIIEDYNQVALLLHSVKAEHSRPYIQALQKKGIQAFCPRARTYFDNEEVRLMVALFAVLFGYYGEGVVNAEVLSQPTT